MVIYIMKKQISFYPFTYMCENENLEASANGGM